MDALGMQNTFICCAFLSMVSTGAFLIMIKWGKTFRKNSRVRYWAHVEKSIAKGMVH
jgi:hypothetical protein